MRYDQTYEFLVLATVLDPHVWLSGFVNDLEGEMLDIGLNFDIREFATNETLGIENTAETISMSIE